MSSNNDDISSLEVVASGKSAATDDINTKGIKEYYYCIYLYIIYIINYCYCVYNRIITVDAKDKEITKRMRI
jgi:hypothetical protein